MRSYFRFNRSKPVGNSMGYVVLLAMIACSDLAGPDAGEKVESILIEAPRLQMEVGETTQLRASPRSSRGELLSNREIAWTSGDSVVATVRPDGVVVARTPGSAVISAESGGKRASVTMLIGDSVPASVQLTPAGEVVWSGNSSEQLVAVLRAKDGSTLAVFPTQPNGRTIQWSTTDPSIASVTPAGMVKTGRAGTAVVRATIGNLSAELRIQVRSTVTQVMVTPGWTLLEVGKTVQLEAEVTPRMDVVRPVTWASDEQRVATVDAAGMVTARAPGWATIRATVEGVTGRATIYVPGAVIRQLQSVGDEPLPATMYVRVHIDEGGVARYRQVVATAGILRMADASRYEMRLHLTVYEGDRIVETKIHDDAGEVWYRWQSGQPLFKSTTFPGLEHDVEFLADNGYMTGQIAISYRMLAEEPAVRLLFKQ